MRKIDINIQGINNSIDSKFNILNQLIRENTPEYKDENFTNTLSEKSIYYIIRSMIYSAKYIKSKSIYEENNNMYSIEDIKSLIRSKFNFDNNTTINEIANILKDIIDNMESNKIKGKLTKTRSHKASLHRYALANNLRCYICGSEVDYHNQEADNYREFEHLIPVSLGGNKNRENIFIACKRCNKAKKNYINWIELDFHMKHQIFINIEKEKEEREILLRMEDRIEKELFYEEKMEKQIVDELLFMVCSLYEYKCAICSEDNDVSDKTYIVKKENKDYCHLFNLMTICDKCLSSVEEDLMSMDNYIKRIRISNVNN